MANLYRNYPPIPSTFFAEEYIAPTGTLAKDVIVSIAGQGKVQPYRGTLAQEIIVSIVGTAVQPIQGQLDQTFAPTVVGAGNVQPLKATLVEELSFLMSGQGVVIVSGTLNATFPVNIAAAGRVPIKAALSATLAPTIIGVGNTAYKRVVDSLPAITSSAVLQNTAPNEIDLPALTSSATLLNGALADVDAAMPAITLFVDLGHDTAAIMPAVTSSATLLAGQLADASNVLPKVTGASTHVQSNLLTVNEVFPKAASVATLEQLAHISTNTATPAMLADATVISGSVATTVLIIPAFTSDGILAEQAIGVLTEVLPSSYSIAFMDNGDIAQFNPYAMNTENYGVTQYNNYDFHSVFVRNGRYYGASSSGIYELTGANDAGTAIAASFKFGFTDLQNSRLKRVPYVYLGYTSDGSMNVDVSIDGQPATRQYLVGNVSNTTGIKRGRAKVAKGLKSRYWQFGASNVNGSDFQVDMMGFYIQDYNRKAQ